MFHKRTLPNAEAPVPPARRFRANIADLFLSNDVSGTRLQTIAEDSIKADPREVRDLARCSNKMNCHRDVLRKLLKGKQWPDLYTGAVRF